jgi:hypothetical protein
MAFAKQERRRFDASGGSRFKLPKLPPAVVVRFFVLALVGVIGAVWAIVHHYTTHPAPMLVPATPSAAPTYDVDAGELPAPEIESAGPQGSDSNTKRERAP